MPMDLFTPSLSNTAALSATTSSARVALASAGATSNKSVRVYNAASVTVFIQFGDATVTATTSHMPIPAGGVECFEVGSATYVAGITGSSSGTVYFTSGNGF